MNHVEELLRSLFVMASLVEARDPYTGGHLWRVAQFSQLLAIRSRIWPGTPFFPITSGPTAKDIRMASPAMQFRSMRRSSVSLTPSMP